MGELFSTPQLFLAAAEEAVHGEGGGHHAISIWGLVFTLLIVLGTIFLLISAARKGFGQRVFTNRWSQYAEQLYLFIENMCVGTIGPHGRKYVPMVITFWLVIFVSNLYSLLLGIAPTAILGFNVGMALLAVGYVQWEGIKSNGLFGHVTHFSGPKLAGPLVLISVMIFIIEIISEFMKNVSLSLRLYGNMSGGHQAVASMNQLGEKLITIGPITTGIPFGELLLPIKLLTAVVQALIFCLLFCVYLSLVTHHEEEGHGEHGAAAH